MVEIEIYDDGATEPDVIGEWPTKKLRVSKDWLCGYIGTQTRYRSMKEFLENYTFDEVDGLEAEARKADAIR